MRTGPTLYELLAVVLVSAGINLCTGEVVMQRKVGGVFLVLGGGALFSLAGRVGTLYVDARDQRLYAATEEGFDVRGSTADYACAAAWETKRFWVDNVLLVAALVTTVVAAALLVPAVGGAPANVAATCQNHPPFGGRGSAIAPTMPIGIEDIGRIADECTVPSHERDIHGADDLEAPAGIP